MDLTTTGLTLAELYEFNLVNGVNTYFTSHDVNIVFGGNTYQAIPIKRGRASYHINLQVDKVDVTLGLVGVTAGVRAYTIPQVIKYGFLRNAHVKITRVDYILLDVQQFIFEGWVTGDIEYNQGELRLHVGSLLDRLNDKFPKVLYAELCNHQLYSTYCGVSRATHQQSGTAGAGSTQLVIYSSVFAYANKPLDWWYKGEIKMTSGLNTDVSGSIVKHSDGSVEILLPFPDAIAVGDGFNVWPGCDKTGTICVSKFNNYANFLGFEYIPKPEVLYYP